MQANTEKSGVSPAFGTTSRSATIAKPSAWTARIARSFCAHGKQKTKSPSGSRWAFATRA